MTVKESTICSLIQSFPVLLILAQKYEKCLHTPFVYKPPTPSPSPEYYQALDALFQNLFGHGYPGHSDYGHHDCYGYGYADKKLLHISHDTYSIPHPCYGTQGYGTHNYGHNTGHNLYGNPGFGIGHPTYGYKKMNVYNSSTGYNKGYAPNQVYNLGHKYKIVVKRNKGRPHRNRSEKLEGHHFPNHRENRYYGEQGLGHNFLPYADRMRQRLSGMLHVHNRDTYNGQYDHPFNDRGISNNQYDPYQQYQNYAYDQYGRPVRFPAYEHNTQHAPYEVINHEYEEPSRQDNSNSFDQPKPVVFPVETNDNHPVQPVENGDNTYQPFTTEKTRETTISTEAISLLPNNLAGERSNSLFLKPVLNNNGFPTLSPVPIVNPKSFPTFSPVTEVTPMRFPQLQPVTNSTNGFLNLNSEKPQVLLTVTTEVQAFPTLNPDTVSLDPAFPKLTPVPEAKKRNNFNFGSEGIFKETCETVDGGVGSCLSIFSCQPYLDFLQQSKSNPALVQILRRAHCGFEGSTPKVCCPRQGIPTAPPSPEPTTTSTTTTSTTTTTVPVTEREHRADYNGTFPEAPVCGFSKASFSRVVGGVDAKLGDFPWMALLGYYSNRTRSTSWKCGGSLITSRHILTAAHCIYNHETDLYVVRVGELDLDKEDDGATPVDILIKSKIMHEKYSPNSFTNDIGILVLKQDIQFTDLIKPICLPRDTELRARSFENYNPIIAGWGDLKYMGPSSKRLQALQLPVVSNEFCSQAFVKYASLKIDERVLCAGYKTGGKDACQGDSGGPLMQPIWNSQEFTTYFYQIGVVSFGKKCAEPGFPGVYTRVTHFVPWIEKTVLGAAAGA